jgi:5-formyltetrahydrofolate cyclo-ligase
MNNKDKARRTLLNKRAQYPEKSQHKNSLLIVNRIQQLEVFKCAKKVAFYHAVRGEADPSALFSNNFEKQFYLPVLSSNKDQGLLFAQVDNHTKYQDNLFSIPEPISKRQVLAESMDLMILPLLGFDAMGNRLGMGGGYYDRSLAFKKEQSKRTPFLIGFAFDFQETQAITAEPWDIKLDAIATESHLTLL